MRSDQSDAGIGCRQWSTFCRTWSGLIAPGMIEATIGWASGNWRAAAASGTSWALQTACISADPIHLFRCGVSVVVLRPGYWARRRDSGIEDAAHHDADPDTLAIGKLLLENILLHQRVTERHQKEIQADHIEEPRHHPQFVDSGADPAHETVRAQLIERPPAGGEELAEIGRDLRFGRMEPEVEIVNEQEVDTVHAEPHL